MSRTVYLFIVLMFASHFWNLKIFKFFINYDVSLISLLVLLVFGGIMYKPRHFIDIKNYSWFCKYLFGGIFISIFMVVMFHEQSLLQTLPVYRCFMPYLFIPMLFRLQPSVSELKKVIMWNCIIGIILTYISMRYYSLFIVDYASLEMAKQNIADKGSTDIISVAATNGFLGNILIFLALSDMIKKVSKTNVFIVMFCYSTCVYGQNRQSMIMVSIILIFSLYKMKGAQFNKLLIIICLGIIITTTSDIWYYLYNETIMDTNTEEYGRMRSIIYFTTEHNNDILCYLFGNGMDSRHSVYGQYIQFLGKEFSIWAGDLGIVGIWSIYGVLPLVAIVTLSIKAIMHKATPYFVKFMGAATFLSPFLMSISGGFVYWWAFLLYFYAYYDTLHQKVLVMKNKA